MSTSMASLQVSTLPVSIGSTASAQGMSVQDLSADNHSLLSTPKPVISLKKPSTRIIVPAARALGKCAAAEAQESLIPIITPKSSSREFNAAGKEKVGRWTEEEHQVFLEGLEKHGKQWKVIAGMIGTRTVVQVRTHAQKYFQRMERHTGNSPVPAMKVQGVAQKRKMSMPTNLPSRVNKKLKESPKKSMQRAVSISPIIPSSSPTNELSAYPSYVSNTSMSSDSSWSPFSPSGVTELNEAFDVQFPFTKGSADELYDFQGLGQDPLEWLIDAEPSILPESSLPVFPDLSTGGSDGHYAETQVVEDSSMPTNVLLEPSYIVDDALDNIADPNVTVQSLFLPPDVE